MRGEFHQRAQSRGYRRVAKDRACGPDRLSCLIAFPPVRRTLALFLLLFGAYAATLGLHAFAAPTTPATSRTTCWRPSRSSKTATSTCSTSSPAKPTPTSTPTSSTSTARDQGPAERAARRRLPAADRPRVRARRRERRRAVPGRDRRAGGRARLPARAARGARPVGDRRGRGRRAVAAVPRLRHRRLPRADRRRGRSPAPRCWRCGSTRARRRRDAFGCFLLLGALPWLGTKFVPAGLVIGVRRRPRALARAPARRSRSRSVELRLFSVALLRRHQRGDLRRARPPTTPTSPARPPPTPASPVGYLDRVYRLVALFIDREYGLLRWAPVFLLAFVGLWLLWRSHRDRLARRGARACATSS